MDAEPIGVLFNGVSAAAIIATLLLVGRQVTEARRAAWATAFGTLYEVLQRTEVRNARRRVLSHLATKPMEDWDPTDFDAVQDVCSTYDAAGIMVRRGLLPTDIVVDSWGDSIMRTWVVAEPMVLQLRADRGTPELADDFEWLANEARSMRT